MSISPLLTDLYELTMMAGYVVEGMHETPATFDLFFRKNPFNGGYAVFAGLEPALRCLQELHFTSDDIAYLESLKVFPPIFLEYLVNFRFRGNVTAPSEGSVVFANEPLLTVTGGLAETQLVETVLLNIINFQTLVATKAARIARAAGKAVATEFGLRRAQGPDGGMSVARAAYIGGIRSTSNVLAGKEFGIPLRGTHAHSWIMSFPDELTAFRKYADVFPDRCIFLVDTYDTISSGIPNAIHVAQELRARGHEVAGIRIDSGDLAWLSREARRMLDEAGFPHAKIVVSGELDEHVIEGICRDGGCVDIFGVGTRLATCAGEGGGALGGVYKVVSVDGIPRMKITGDVTKATIPDVKKVYRGTGPDGKFVQDIMCMSEELPHGEETVYDPENPLRHCRLKKEATFEDIRSMAMVEGKIIVPSPGLSAIADFARSQLEKVPEESLRLLAPHPYKVSISSKLNDLRLKLIEEIQSTMIESPRRGHQAKGNPT